MHGNLHEASTYPTTDNFSPWYQCSGLHPSADPPANSVAASTSIYTSAYTDPHERPFAIKPIIGNNDGPLGASSAPENTDRAEHALYLHAASLMSPTGCDYSGGNHSRQWWTAQSETADALLAHGARSVDLPQDRRQVPPGDNAFGQRPQHGDDHAVRRLPAPPTSPRDTHTSHPIPVISFTPAHTGSDGSPISPAHILAWIDISPMMATDSGMAQVLPSPFNRRRHYRRPRAPTHVVCDKCSKSMRRQSLKRHIREVHDHIKRLYPKPRSAAGPFVSDTQ